MIIDLHVHTSAWSDDSNLELPELIRQAKQAGIDAICLTEHDRFPDKNILIKTVHEYDFLLLPGVEINTDDGHFLVLGVEEYSFGLWHTEHLRHVVDEAGGVMILAHPYRRQYHTGEDLDAAIKRCCQKMPFSFIDLIEVLNGRASDMQNNFSQELCRRLNMRGIGGSDAHSLSDIPSCATFFERKVSNIEELITELKAGRFKAIDLRKSR